MDERSMWEAVLSRDESLEDTFVYAVASTGVYCRTTCPSRRPRRDNVRFFRTPVEAERAGFRPCRRCDPPGTGPAARRRALVARACELLDAPDAPSSLHELAREVGMSPYHLHRLFKEQIGITPKGYQSARRMGRIRKRLAAGSDVTSAIYDTGFGSSGRFYVTASERLGMEPRQLRAGAPGLRIRLSVRPCSLGWVAVAATDRGICFIALGDDAEQLGAEVRSEFHAAELVDADPAFDALVGRVVELVEDPAAAVDLPLDVRGTAFQERVWQALRTVPAGTTVTYGELAERVGAPGSARAVGRACATNPVAVAVPCHRVVHHDGTISGYRWGPERKIALLAREAEASRQDP